MATTYHWSDLHLGHRLVAEARGFDSVEAHDQHIIDAWHRTIRKNDIVNVLGDISSGAHQPALEIIASLPGRKRIKWGNHDKPHPASRGGAAALREFLEVFESGDSIGMHRVGGRQFMLSHFPYTGERDGSPDRYSEFRLRDTGLWLVHGHVHEAWAVNGRQINVGVDRWMNGPVSDDSILAIMDGASPESAGAVRW